ncbi:hypothetical protein XA68_17615 [Ophiocordyceps unilateralis]|uniref:Uncharacterized protein n=1 Tax=Ophiocordyceps unilateralis TaxID=268505 RepID=A0A2A9P482_OPHUN|nr:hypothetical protein XA68_17615 [Ophiocordyceps unilateralis]
MFRRAIIRRLLSTAGLSFRRGPSQPALLTRSIPDHFSEIVRQHGARPAIISRTASSPPTPTAANNNHHHHQGVRETTLTYSELDALSSVLARGLASQAGIQIGDRVGIALGNGVEFAALTYAVYKLGAVLVPLNPTLGLHQIRAALSLLRVKVLVVAAVVDLPFRPGRGRANDELLLRLRERKNGRTDGLERVFVVDNRQQHGLAVLGGESGLLDAGGGGGGGGDGFISPYTDLLSPPSSSSSTTTTTSLPSATELSPTSVINIQFTSGTTSAPKAAQLSHLSILNNGNLIADRMGLTATDRIVVPPPLFHCFGSVLGYMATATTGAAILFPSPAFDADASLRMAVEHRATGLHGVPTMFIAMLEALDSLKMTPPPGLTKGIASGSSVPESLVRRIHQRLGLQDLVICYGQTETGPVSCMTSPDDDPDKLLSSVGRPLPHTAVKIVDPTDRSVVVPVGDKGELAASGYLLMNGYYNDPLRTRDVLRQEPDADGEGASVWMYSGDEAVMCRDGYVSITGRIKDLIIRGGENINPLEIENCLRQLPAVRDVSVVGVPCPRLGEAVAAFVRTADDRLTADDVRDCVRARLSSHLVPKHVFFWPDEFPKTASGKVQKFKLREDALARLKKEA